MKKVYETQIKNIGGREGRVSSPDGAFQYNITSPGKRVENATNPEQLFAAAYSSCFNGALGLAMEQENDVHDTTVNARVSLFHDETEGFHIEVVLEIHIADVSETRAKELAHLADGICPYSKAILGNVPVTLEIV